jgi:RNA polymerase sigma-70 factor (ECF subfamily)
MLELTDRKTTFETKALPYIDVLYRTATWMLIDEHDAENLVEQTYAKAYHHRDKFHATSNCQAYLFKTMMSIFAKDFPCRHKSLSLTDAVDVGDHILCGHFANLEANLEYLRVLFSSIPSAEIKRTVMALPDDFKLVVVLSWLEGFSYQEIGYIAGIRLEAVKSRLFQGRKLLKKELYKYTKGEGNLNAVI